MQSTIIILEYLRFAVILISSETIIFFMQLHLPYFSWDSSQYAFAACKILGNHLFYAAAALEGFRINFT